ncbi:nuclear transport factor 2 family protein, partial [Rhodococcus sp. EPR-134]
MSQAESEVGSISAVEELLAIEEIKRVFAARLRCMDTKQWHVYPTLHTADVVSETWGGLPTDKQPKTGDTSNQVVGIDKLTAAIRNMLDGDIPLTTAHHAHTPEIVLTSPTTATG